MLLLSGQQDGKEEETKGQMRKLNIFTCIVKLLNYTSRWVIQVHCVYVPSLQPNSPLDHLFSTYQVNIMQSCDLCGSYIWGMEKAYMCSGEFKELQDHKIKLLLFFFL